jgi:DNA-binding LacI/PurR family transcriptional regulator
MATIKEVAALAGVTPTTVTNVLRGRGRVSEATRARVLDAVRQKGYRPNLTARALVERKAPTLALMLGCITNPFYPEFTLQAQLAARRHERFLLICNTDEERDGGKQFIEQVAGSLSDGVLVANNGELDLQALLAVSSRGTPVVISVWEDPATSPGIPAVAFDSRRAGRLATAHLIALGHRRIGAVIASSRQGIHSGRYLGFRDALNEAGLACDERHIRFCTDTFDSGYAAALALFGEQPDISAVFVSNDLPALGVLNAAADRGLSVPADLSVVSITDIHQAAQSRPSLSTVRIPTAEMAARGIELLLDLLEKRVVSGPVICIPDLTLIARQSTAAPRARD